jgi:hypothetical protein
MRCTRCDGLVVPQAVGIDPDGKVVFGWCLRCLAERGCRLVETSPLGPWTFDAPGVSPGRSVARARAGRPPRRGLAVDRSRWAIAVVALLMMCWGLVLLAAGLWRAPRPGPGPSPLGNGTSSLLAAGGAATALVGLVLLLLASRRNWYPGTFLLGLLSWLSFLVGLGILLGGVIDHEPRRNPSLVLGAGLALGISVLARLIHRSQARKLALAAPAARATGPGFSGTRPRHRRPSF